MNQETTGKIPVMQVVKEAYAFFAANWVRFAPAAVIVSVVGAVSQLILLPLPGGIILAPAATTLASVAFSSSVLRYSIRGEFSAPLGLQLGPDEFRLLGVWLGLVLVFGPLALLAGMTVLSIIVGRLNLSETQISELAADPDMFMQTLAEGVRPIDAVLVLFFCAVALYISSRLTMVYAATIGERRMVAFQSWGWSKGNVGRVIGAVVLAALPSVIAAFVNERIIIGIGGASSEALFFAVALVTWISLMLGLPLVALGAILYKGLRPPDFKPK